MDSLSEKQKRSFASICLPVLPSILCSLFFFLFALFTTGIYFESNDDSVISGILNGSFLGFVDIHTIYSNPILSAFFVVLYRLFPGLPWWSIGLTAFYLLSAICMFLSFIHLLKKSGLRAIYAQCLGCLTGLAILFYGFYFVGRLQYTSVAMFMSLSGYLYLISHLREKKSFLVFFLLELSAFLLRDQAMLLVQPFGFPLLMLSSFHDHRQDTPDSNECTSSPEQISRKFFSKVSRGSMVSGLWFSAKTLLLTGLICLIGLSGHLVAGEYAPSWQGFKAFNQTRTLLYDYYLQTPYENMEPILAPKGIDEVTWNAFSNYMVYDWPVEKELQKQLDTYLNAQREKPSFSLLKHYIWEETFGGTDRRILFLMWGALFLLGLMLADPLHLISVLGLMLSHTLVWGFLYYRGRIQLRVSMPLYVCEISLVMVLLFLSLSRLPKGKNLLSRCRKWGCTLVALLLMGILVFFSRQMAAKQILDHKTFAAEQDLLAGTQAEVYAYCNTHADTRYLLDIYAFGTTSGKAFDTALVKEHNCCMCGGWYTMAPNFLKSLKAYFSDADSFCFIAPVYTAEQDLHMQQAQLAYLAKRSGSEPEVTDHIVTSSGRIFTVYTFEGPLF